MLRRLRISFKSLISFLLLVLFFSSCKTIPGETSIPKDGYVRLEVNEKTGGFLLFYFSDPEKTNYEPLFNNNEQGASSYTSINIDGNVFKLGDRNFRPALDWQNGNPVLTFESSALKVTQAFTPVRMQDSAFDSGVMITYAIYNYGDQSSLVGLRLLIDTTLGEWRGTVPFITQNEDLSEIIIGNETLIRGSQGAKYWISRGKGASLMGSIANPLNADETVPDIYFANWKRLHNSAWEPKYSQNRSFGSDSAVCYVYEPALIESGGVLSYTIFLTTEDTDLYNLIRYQNEPVQNDSAAAAVIEEKTIPEPSVNNINADIQMLLRLQDVLNQFINGEIDLNEQDLLEIERAIERLGN